MAEQSKHSVKQTSREGQGQDIPITRRGSEGGENLSQQPQGRWSGIASGFAGGSPFSVVRRMMEDMDRFFENFGSGLFPSHRGAGQAWSLGTWSPDVEVSERDGNLVVSADLPGIRKEDIDIELQDDALILRGHRHEEHEEQRGNVSYSERSYGSFVRTIALPTGVKPDDVDASCQNGVLKVSVRLPQESGRRRIEIRGGSAEQETRNLPGTAEQSAPDKSTHN